ncbi:MAG: radical SAM family heme chaperone HemW [Ruminococcaceae bacterium]|nr:radical SAM family heme chaperone HemW [Oscillospiraceae bacterium]
MKDRGLYIHIPFCAAKCAYCDFYSLPSSSLHERYVGALCKSGEILSEKYSDTVFSSVYIGGGTPSILSAELLEKLLGSVKKNFTLSKDVEFTLEANPATLDEKKMEAIVGGGVNRMSFGCQSANEDELKKLGRLHGFESFKESFSLARRYGINNVSADLMYGIPLQSISSLLFSINAVAELTPDHISLYGLRVEENTPFGRDKDLVLPSDDTQCEMYLRAVETMRKLGYERYEISNFARSGKYSRHNMRYWECSEYLGLGAAAHSYIDGRRFAFERSATAYIDALESGKMPTPCESEHLSKSDELYEYVMLSLRLEKGISLSELSRRFGARASRTLIEKSLPYHGKFMVFDGECLHFTSDGFLVSNTILSEII